ncbi:MAG: nucleotide sugar dehydrogenase [Chloroflexi bacterium]|nr:nucleotide sugar dehydrogenase [Chloroflexota bacterium]MBE3114144.1 nucleotide sugar dehydrogenase [Actinomycetota bacterium]
MEIKGLYKELESKEKKIAVIGLGYVGLPLLIGFSKHFQVIGFDTSSEKIKNLKNDIDENKEIETEKLSSLDCFLTSNASDLKNANFFIIAVPTPIDNYKNPDLCHIKEATILVGQNMPEGSIVVYESTVYPGVTEEFCIPLLEKESGLKNRKDFYVGYSPERINPGDKEHSIENIIKVVSAQTEDTLEVISKIYSKVVKAGIFRAKSIKVAEAAKVIENTQRDINVALINELAILFSKLGIDTKEVLEAARTKWNFLDFTPGLVGGHCIGIDPYYLSFKAREVNYYPDMINAGRRINDNMGFFIGEQILETLLKNHHKIINFKVVLFGISFKENVADSRNSRVIDIYDYLMQHNIDVRIFDPVVNSKEVKENYGIELIKFEEVNNIDAAIFCVAHDYFKKIDLIELKSKMSGDNPFIFDIKWIFDKEDIEKLGYGYWRV